MSGDAIWRAETITNMGEAYRNMEARALAAESALEAATLSARVNSDLADKWQIECGRLAADLEAATETLRHLHSEVDCRIEHGAESGGHLEYVRAFLARTDSGKAEA